MEGWTLYNGMCYNGSVNPMKWDEARLECEAQQAVLASVHDEDTARFIKNYMGG